MTRNNYAVSREKPKKGLESSGFDKPAEELPQFLVGVQVIPAPRMSAANNLIQPHFAVIRSAGKAVFDNLPAVRGLSGQGIGLHDRAAVLCRAEVYGKRYGKILAPATFVFRIAQPGRSFVGRAVDFEERHRDG